MPWKTSDEAGKRWDFVQARLKGKVSMAELCREHGISRECGYKWWRRFSAGGRKALKAVARKPSVAEQQWQRWWPRVRALRRMRPHWGADKLHWELQRRYPLGPWPTSRTMGRWLEQAGLTEPRVRHARKGPVLAVQAWTPAEQPNDVWTIDLKGAFFTGNRTRITPLTVRDAASSLVLLVRHLWQTTEPVVCAALQKIFRRYGLPKVIHVDNGPPFGRSGARGWSALSVEWVRLGIKVEFSRPACPQDNPAHEQMHRVLKAETASPPAANARAQQQRFNRWQHVYNYHRPHAALGQQVPAAFYQPSPRSLPATRPKWDYPADWSRVRTDAKGRYRWAGRQRQIGRAFVGEQLGLRLLDPDTAEIYLGPHLLGTLHRHDRSGLRPVQWRHTNRAKREGLRPSLDPPIY